MQFPKILRTPRPPSTPGEALTPGSASFGTSRRSRTKRAKCMLLGLPQLKWHLRHLQRAHWNSKGEWQRPVRGGELEQLLCHYLANAIDRMLGRCPLMTPCGPVLQTEWPRVFGNWKFTLFLTLALLMAVLW